MKTVDTSAKDRLRRKIPRPGVILLRLLGIVFAVCVALYTATTVWPSIGARGADVLRGWIGDPAVAWLEGAVFQVQDSLLQMQYRLGAEPEAPWAMASVASPPLAVSTMPATLPVPTVKTGAARTATAGPPEPSATPIRWPPPSLQPFGDLAGEGKWIPYIQNARGETTASRTFLQPDAERPYAIAAVVAVNLDTTRLQYVLGFEEPYFAEGVVVERTGIIPREDKQPGTLLAAFNGGFLTRHGLFGVMVDGEILVPMVEGLGTLAIYPDGRVRIGVWGSDLTSLEGISTVRQNGAIVIQNGAINPRAFENSLELWGASLSGEMTTWRSAVGVSADGRTFYYVAGWSLNMPALARALQQAGVYAAIQLDINHFWVLFTRFVFGPDGPEAEPLLEGMEENVDRYLYASARDYFYLAAKAR
jgi:hypothetical protein